MQSFHFLCLLFLINLRAHIFKSVEKKRRRKGSGAVERKEFFVLKNVLTLNKIPIPKVYRKDVLKSYI